jgi:hypothetical protein
MSDSDGEPFDYERFDREQAELDQQHARFQHLAEQGFVRITPQLCSFFAPYGPWVEIGAGLGRLTAGIRLAGGRSLATDNFSSSYIRQGDWLPSNVHYGDAERVARLVARSATLSLLCSWPYESEWSYRAIQHLRIGQVFGYIGEGPGGQTGSISFHELLEDDFEVIAEMEVEKMVKDVHDHATIYRRITVSNPAKR